MKKMLSVRITSLASVLKPKALVSALLLSIGLMVVAQQYSSVDIGKLTTFNKLDMIVAVDSAGTIVLSTAANNIYIDRPSAISFGNSLVAIIAGMKELETKDLTVIDYQAIGASATDRSSNTALDTIKFRLRFNSTKEDKVLLLMYSSHDYEDMLFTTNLLTDLDDLINKAVKVSFEYTDQYAYIQSVADRIDAARFR